MRQPRPDHRLVRPGAGTAPFYTLGCQALWAVWSVWHGCLRPSPLARKQVQAAQTERDPFAPQFLSVVLTNLTSSSKYYYTVGDDVRTPHPTP